MEESCEIRNKDVLIELIQEIDDQEFINFTYKFVKRLKENWGV